MSSLVKRDEKVVDVGCGVGIWSSLMARKGAYVVSLDPSKRMLQRARQRFAISKGEFEKSLIISDGFYLPFRNDVFDGATLNWVLAHIPAKMNEWFMTEIARVVKRGGWLFISDSYWRGQERGKEQIHHPSSFAP